MLSIYFPFFGHMCNNVADGSGSIFASEALSLAFILSIYAEESFRRFLSGLQYSCVPTAWSAWLVLTFRSFSPIFSQGRPLFPLASDVIRAWFYLPWRSKSKLVGAEWLPVLKEWNASMIFLEGGVSERFLICILHERDDVMLGVQGLANVE